MSNAIDVNSFVISFKDNFVNSLDNNCVAKIFYSSLGYCKNIKPIVFHIEEIQKSVSQLSNSSALDCDGLNSLHLKYAHPAIYSALKLLFNSMLEYGLTLDNFGTSVLTPVVKNASRSLLDVSNYRPIAITSVIAKYFESLIDIHFGHFFSFLVNQFGFSSGGGCNKAIFALNNTVKYFRERHSNMFLCALDMTKAFDRINQFIVLRCMLERGFPVELVNVMLQWFRSMKACVKWGCNTLNYFNIKSGCAQGSILGPKLFNLVIDKLLHQLEKSQLGCKLGLCYAGAFGYADDIILLLSSGRHSQLMFDLCCGFGAECDL